MRKEIYASMLADRDRRLKWQKAGGLDIIARARVKVEEILKTSPESNLDLEVEKPLTIPSLLLRCSARLIGGRISL